MSSCQEEVRRNEEEEKGGGREGESYPRRAKDRRRVTAREIGSGDD